MLTMDSKKDKRQAVSQSLAMVSKSEETGRVLVYPSPPNSPPRSRFDFRGALNKAGDVCHTLAMDRRSLSASKEALPDVTTTDSTETRLSMINNAMTSSHLRSLLGLGGNRCGALRPNKLWCRSPIREPAKTDINALIESMLNSKESSTTYIPDLDKLVKLVHCRYHNYGTINEPRIQTWNKLLCVELGRPIPVLPIEKQIIEALGQISTLCRGINLNELSCQRKLGGQKVQNCGKTVKEIIKREVFSNDQYLHELLEVLAANMYCYQHISDQGHEQVTLWKTSITKIHRDSNLDPVTGVKEGSEEEAVTSNNNIPTSHSPNEGDHAVATQQELLQIELSRSISAPFRQSPAEYWPNEYDITPFEIIGRNEQLSDPTSSYDIIKEQMIRTLDLQERASGHVYMYEVEGNQGLVKIGYTTRTLRTRHEEWEFDCNRKSKALYPPPMGRTVSIPNVRRVEALCHAELAHRKIVIHCTGCLKQHIEWFEISSAEAIQVIKKWTNWMRTGPYKNGVLKAGVRQEVINMTDFMEDLSEYAT